MDVGLNYDLDVAADEGNLDEVKRLVELGAGVSDEALKFASSNGNLDMVKYLVSRGGTDLNEGIISAIEHGHLDVVEYLVSQGGDVTDDDFIVTASREGYLNIVEYLVSQGAPMYTPYILEIASENGHLEVVKYIIEYERPLEDDLSDALVTASKNGHLEVVKYLVSQEADISTDDEAPFRLASANGHLEVLKYLQKEDPNIDFTIENNDAIKQAAQNGHFKVVKYIAELCPDNISGIDGALIAASRADHLDIIKYLVLQGAKATAEDNSAIREAAENGHLDVVKYLISKKADIDIAISTAKEVGNIQMVQELEEIREADKTDYPTEIAKKGNPKLGHLKKEEMEEYTEECTNPPFLGEIEEYGSAEPGQVVVVKEGGKLFCFTIEEILGLEESGRNPFTRTILPKKLFIEARKRKKVYDRYPEYFGAEDEEVIGPKTMAYSKLWNTISSRGYPIDQESYDDLSNSQVQDIFDIVVNDSKTSLSPAVIVRVRGSDDKHLSVVEAFNELLDKSTDKNTDSLLIIQSFNKASLSDDEQQWG